MKNGLLILGAVSISGLAMPMILEANAQSPDNNSSVAPAVAPPRSHSCGSSAGVSSESQLPPNGASLSNEGAGRQFGGSGGGNSPERQEMRQRMMQRFDANHDGALDDSERAQMKEAMEQRRKEMETRFDANHDGQLDDGERAQMREFMQQRRMQQNNGSGQQP